VQWVQQAMQEGAKGRARCAGVSPNLPPATKLDYDKKGIIMAKMSRTQPAALEQTAYQQES
jgi:hypothetical protein